MSDSVLKKQFKKHDVERLRNLVKGKTGDKTTTGIGYNGEESISYKEGDIWKENGKTWTIRDGIKENITKLDKFKSVAVPIFCPSCKGNMDKQLDPYYYKSYGECVDCRATTETQLKKDGKTPDAPKVVLGQIHAKDVHAATVKLLWEGASKPVRVILNKSTEKSAFSVKLGKIADPSKPWTYMIKMTEKGIELAAGGVTKTLTFGKELDNVWKKEKFYFKAGLYIQDNTANSNDLAQVTYYALENTHN